jgi:hypothetical protein
VFENRVLRGIFGPKESEVIGEWRQLHDEKFYYTYSSPHVFRMTKPIRMRSVVNVARMVDIGNSYTVIVGESERLTPLGSSRGRCEDNIKTDLRESMWENVTWIQLHLDRNDGVVL